MRGFSRFSRAFLAFLALKVEGVEDLAKASYFDRPDMEAALRLLTPANRLVMAAVLHTGRRVGDILAIRADQLRSNTIWITEQKTGKRSKIQLPDSILEPIRKQAGTLWAFPGRSDESKHRTRQAVWHDLHRAAKALRLEGSLGTHSGRKLYAVELMRQWRDLGAVQRDLRHSNPAVTMLYAFADQLSEGRRPKVRNRRGRS